MSQATHLVLKPLTKEAPERIAVLSLDRPEAANSFNAAVIDELTAHLDALGTRSEVRALVLRGKGKHFSAGADLGWMKASAALSYDDNIRDARKLTGLFERLAHLPMPTLAVVTGSAFGGAVGLAACCDVVLATTSARFALSEVKLGLIPAVILPYLARKMVPGQLRRLGLSGRLFSAAEALSHGLVQRVVAEEELAAALREELEALLMGSPEAQASFKRLLHEVTQGSLAQGDHTAEAIARLRVSPAGQAGLGAFFEKKPAPWLRGLDADWSLDEA